MNSDEYRVFLQTKLTQIGRFNAPGGVNHIVTRCFYCPDSKNRNHGHMYILIPPDKSNTPSYFYCQKCHSSGLVTSARLLDWGIYEYTMAADLTSYNSKVLLLPENRKFRDSETYRVNNTLISNDKLTMYKVEYINKRLGTNLTIKDCIDNKIVLNIKDLLYENKLQITRDTRIVDSLDSDFVGFLSYDNAFINMRNLEIHNNLHDSINKRYVNYNIFNKFENTARVYIIPGDIILDDKRPIELHMAEGPFDILSIKYNLHSSHFNKIYSSILGSGYKGLLKFILSHLKIPNLLVHVYPDSDADVFAIIDLIECAKAYGLKIIVHKNKFMGEKDYGVPKNRIIDTIEDVSNMVY